MNEGKVILESKQFQLTIDRRCYQLIENYSDFSNVSFIGIQDRGVLFSNRIIRNLQEITGEKHIQYGKLDITFYRDDFRRRDVLKKSGTTEIDFIIEGKPVILIDDVLYTGRTIQAALTAIQHYGRPAKVELMCIVDRRFNRHLPIQPDYVGITVDSIDEAYVKVEWAELDGQDRILLFSKRNQPE